MYTFGEVYSPHPADSAWPTTVSSEFCFVALPTDGLTIFRRSYRRLLRPLRALPTCVLLPPDGHIPRVSLVGALVVGRIDLEVGVVRAEVGYFSIWLLVMDS
jgi:hypothetical protein